MKRFILLLLSISFIFLLGCHGTLGAAPFVMPDEFDTSRNYEITFWAKNDTNKTQTAIYEKAIEDFSKLYPNITVKLRLYTDYGRIYNDVITNIATKTTPNVCITYPDHIATYITGSNTVVPLDELMADTAYGLGGTSVLFDSPTSDEIVPKFLSEGVIDNVQYALPYMRSTEALYVNKTYVEALGYTLPDVVTWDFVWEVSEKALAKDENGNYIVNGQKVMIPFIYKSTDNMMIHALYQSGGEYSSNDGDILLFNDTTKDFLRTISTHAKSGAFSTFKISSYPANFLNAGQCIFAVDSTAGATWMGANAPLIDISEESIVDFETVVLPIPQYDKTAPIMISQGPSVCIFNKSDVQEVLASWLFCQYLLTNEVQLAYAKTEGYVPVTTKAQNAPEYLDYLAKSGTDNNLYYPIKIDASKLLLKNLDNTFVTPVWNGSASLRNAAGQLIENVTKSTNRGEEVDDKYFDTLFSNVSALYRLSETGSIRVNNRDLGPLPPESVLLLIALAVAWLIIIISTIFTQFRGKLSNKRGNIHNK